MEIDLANVKDSYTQLYFLTKMKFSLFTSEMNDENKMTVKAIDITKYNNNDDSRKKNNLL